MVKIISGGQTGVDRAALDVAIELGLPYSGWCPKDGWAEDQPAPPGVLALYPGLRETPDADPSQRTQWNVRDSDRLLVLAASGFQMSKGTVLAVESAKAFAKPHLVIDLDRSDGVGLAVAFIGERDGTICIGGPRESEAPGIYAKARVLLRSALARRRPSR